MDSDVSGYVLNHATPPSGYYNQSNDDGNIIDLGLSLRIMQPEAYPSSPDDYDVLIDWQQLHPQLKNPKIECSKNVAEKCDNDEREGRQSKPRWRYVKVNMDGVIVGRKICLLEDMGYSTLALQLEDMFGKHYMSGLRLYQEGSEFSLYYKDRDERWRTVGDVPWKEFVDCVKRLRIVHKNGADLVHSSSPIPHTY